MAISNNTPYYSYAPSKTFTSDGTADNSWIAPPTTWKRVDLFNQEPYAYTWEDEKSHVKETIERETSKILIPEIISEQILTKLEEARKTRHARADILEEERPSITDFDPSKRQEIIPVRVCGNCNAGVHNEDLKNEICGSCGLPLAVK